MAVLSTQRIQFETALANLLEQFNIDGSTSGTIIAERLSLINLVKAKLDEIIPEGEGIQFADEASPNISDPMALLINAILNEAAKRVLMNCPKNYLDAVKSNATAVANSVDNKIGYILLAANFLRFISLKMAEWKRPVTDITETETEEYLMQFNTHVRGGLAKPKAIMNRKYLINTLGGLVTVTLNAGGTGYTEGAVVLTVVQSGASGGTINATADAGGIITSINSIETAGKNYFVDTAISTTAAAGTGCKVNITVIETGYSAKRIIEYFSILNSHTIDYLFYIQETAAENVQSNLWDSMSWIAAGMVLQITERGDLAKLAFEQEQMCYNKL